MDNLRLRLIFYVGENKGINHHAGKNILKLVKLQILAATCCKMENIALRCFYTFVCVRKLVIKLVTNFLA